MNIPSINSAMIRKTFPAIAVTVLLVSLFGLFSIWKLYIGIIADLRITNQWVAHTFEVKSIITSLRAELYHAESNQRGFLLAASDIFLIPYLEKVSNARQLLDHLKEITKDNSVQQQNCLEAIAIFEKRIESLDTMLELRKSSGPEIFSTLISTGQIGSERVQLDTVLSRMEKIEERLLAVRTATSDESWKNGSELASLITLINIGVMIGSCLMLTRYYRRTELAKIALDESKRAAESANHSKSAFVANISHEIRTPMTAIMGYTDLLFDPDISGSERLNYVQSIRRNGDHLLKIINDILDISKIEADKISITREEVHLPRLIANLASMMRQRVYGKPVLLDFINITPIPESMEGDELRIRQILINLLGNAIKFTEKGEVILQVESTETQIQFHIVDTGIGMSTDDIAQLFVPFSQADASTTRRFGGTGLGLTISKRLIELHGGTLSVESVLGRGSVFTVTLPLTRPVEKWIDDIQPLLISEPISGNLREEIVVPRCVGKVLLVEDNPDNQQLISYHLKKVGVKLTVVDTGKKAVDQALESKKQNTPYDLILLDMQLPEMDGYTAVALLRKKGYTQPIVALSANVIEEDRKRSILMGCDEFLSKPIELKKFFATISSYLKKSETVNDSMESLADDAEFIMIKKLFVDSLVNRIAELNQAVAHDDWKQIQKIAHKVSGVAANYGFEDLSLKAQVIDTRIMENDQSNDVAILIKNFIAQLEETTKTEREKITHV